MTRTTPGPAHAGSLTTLALGLIIALTGCTETQLALEPEIQPAFSNVPVVIMFDKEFNAGESTETLLVWHGTVEASGLTGDLVSSIDLTEPGTIAAGKTLLATIRWVATGDVEFEIVTTGVINLANGVVRSNGYGVSGLGAGANVHQQGQLTGLDAAGFLRFQPATAR